MKKYAKAPSGTDETRPTTASPHKHIKILEAINGLEASLHVLQVLGDGCKPKDEEAPKALDNLSGVLTQTPDRIIGISKAIDEETELLRDLLF